MNDMERLAATLVLLGYVLLVPFCFFGGMTMAHTAMDMEMIGAPMSDMDMGDCGLAIGGCAAHGGVFGTIAHHVGMYLSLTSGTPGVVSVLFAIAALFAFSLFSAYLLRCLRAILSASRRSLAWVAERTHTVAEHRLLTWLALFETSPNFA